MIKCDLALIIFGQKYLHAVIYQHALQMLSDAPIDIESLRNRLLKFYYVPTTSTRLNRLLFLFAADINSTNEANKVGSMCH